MATGGASWWVGLVVALVLVPYSVLPTPQPSWLDFGRI